MQKIFNFLFQLILLGIAGVVTLIFTSDHEFKLRYNVEGEDYKPGGQFLTFNSNYPLKTEFQIDDIELSLVVPAYNEESRLPIMIDQAVKYFSDKGVKFEIIIVNDGSKDRTWEVIQDLAIKRYPNIEITGITYNKNSGKGYAVTTGMKYTRGLYILMLDADGATDIQDYEKLRKVMDKIKTDTNEVIVIGSRNHLVEEVVAKRAWYRNILMHINNFIVRSLLGVKDIKDTQCGFKLFSRKAAKDIFFKLHLVRWAFDVEILYIAQHLDIPVFEIPVSFTEVEGSKLNVVSASISFIRDYFAMIVFYNTGYWRLPMIL